MTTLRPLTLRLCALALLAAPALATGGTTVPFTNSVNTGGWTWGPTPVFPAAGGNPDWYLRGFVDTFAPQARTTGLSAFTGDFRARDVVEIGCDLRTLSTQFPFSRPLSLILSNGSRQVWTVGSALVPQVAEGWRGFHFAIPSQSATLPAGWVASGSGGTPDQEWNTVITNVTEVRFFYGDPDFFFIFDQWTVGIDNPRIFCDPWIDLGSALAGTPGAPLLVGTGSLAPNSPVALALTNVLPNSATTFVIGASALSAPFKGGLLVPNPDVLLAGFPTGPAGAVTLAGTWPAGLPSGFTFYFQCWTADAGGPAGFSASNALRATTP